MKNISQYLGRCSTIILLVTMLISEGCESRPDPQPVSSRAKGLLKQLESTQDVFVGDGAYDFHVSVELQELRSDILRELIPSISANTPTHTVYRTADTEVTVPFGYLVLDFLLLMSSEDSVVFSDSPVGDDIPWSCVRADYIFMPDILSGQETMLRVQKMWAKASREGRLKFER